MVEVNVFTAIGLTQPTVGGAYPGTSLLSIYRKSARTCPATFCRESEVSSNA